MKEGSGVLMMAVVSPSAAAAAAAYSSPAMVVPTPSPFSFSVASTRWSSSRPSIRMSGLFCRAMVLVFSFASSLALAATMSNNNHHEDKPNDGHEDERSFQEYPEFVYSFVVTTLVFVYSAYQLFKGVTDIAYRGIFISDRTSDYVSFVLDQLAGYLLLSCSSVTALAIHHEEVEAKNTSMMKAAMVCVCMSFVAFFITAASAILSGYKLSKRIMW
ncbi:CASP-like protein 4A4 [Cynara cardunculus var. scolymus]|uniref:CASP-like protein 4A4 n=1 Tax=Cynara cardunculus var. scolymus TaxID=59895 RepID=UPI000D628F9E|nr:CASP-like protein 4A4 [Cynara cardunculus var. scolymus]